MSAPSVQLRDVEQDDLAVLFQQQLDPEAIQMAAFTSPDPTDETAYLAHWDKLFASETIQTRAIESDGALAGYVAKFERDGDPEITYWLGRDFWGRGIATTALRRLMSELPERPVYARAAKDNLASIRVLEKCGFQRFGEDRGFANARGEEIDEVVMALGASPAKAER